ncbi:MAG: hypothetical protein R6V26_13905 [Roseovarius sp.]
MMKRAGWCFLLSVAALLSGCATPKQQCLSEVTQELRSVERALETAQGNIARGYAVHTQRVPYTVADICYRTHPRTHAVIPYSCPSTYYRTQTTPVAIDVAEERRKADAYRRMLPRLRDEARAGIRQCNAQFPE